MGSKHSSGSTSPLLKVKLRFFAACSYWLAGLLGKVDKRYSDIYVQVHGSKRLSELMSEEAEYWKDKYRANK